MNIGFENLNNIIIDDMTTINFKQGPIGLISDSHSNNLLMTRAIDILIDKGAKNLIHLGDACDSIKPEKADEAVEILNRYNVNAVMGNNEYVLISEYLASNSNTLKDATVSFLRELPYTLKIRDICFTHSTPFDWPAATRQPITNYLPFLKGENPPFRIIFTGHSHGTSVIEIGDEGYKSLKNESGKTIHLHEDRVYAVTIGAIEDGICAIFDSEKSDLCFIKFLVR